MSVKVIVDQRCPRCNTPVVGKSVELKEDLNPVKDCPHCLTGLKLVFRRDAGSILPGRYYYDLEGETKCQ